jgi:hypothetical protein
MSLFTSADFPRDYAGAEYLRVGTHAGGVNTYYAGLAQVYQANFPPGSQPLQWAGFYGVDARLALMIAEKEGLAGAQGAYSYLWPYIAVNVQDFGLPDLSLRPGWAVANPGEN